MSAQTISVAPAAAGIKKNAAQAAGKKSELFHTEDWLAVWIGIFVIGAAAIGVLTGAYDFSAAKFSTWAMECPSFLSGRYHLS